MCIGQIMCHTIYYYEVKIHKDHTRQADVFKNPKPKLVLRNANTLILLKNQPQTDEKRDFSQSKNKYGVRV